MQTLDRNGSSRWGAILLATAVALSACRDQAETNPPAGERPASANSTPQLHVRQPAVAGLFYPKDPKALAAIIDRYLAAAPAHSLTNVKALICPHAGYEYSGPVAAHAYKLIAGGNYDTVIILAPSHYAVFAGAAVPAADVYETPLGPVPVSAKARALAKKPPFELEPRSFVQRPAWSSAASKPEPAAGEDTPDTWEHAAEVQVPFLQRTLKDFKILPVIFGRVDPEAVAQALAPIVDDRTLLIASSDLSHYHPYEAAQRLDRQTVQWICEQDIAALQSPEAEDRACGRVPILTLLHLARLKGWTPHLLDCQNSGDTAGDKSRVVGYAALAFTSNKAKPKSVNSANEPAAEAQFNAADRKFLLDLARQTLHSATAGSALPEVKLETVPAACRIAKGCFVTLTKDGALRGCIGNILPAGPLYRSVEVNARNAALRDPRFPPVMAAEAGALHIEVSVLTLPEPLAFASPDDLLAKLVPRRDGVVLRIGERSATYLPQVWEQLPAKAEFLSHLALKAGCLANAWRGPDVQVLIYRAEVFGEVK